MRPFIPDKANALPANWKAILRSWVSGRRTSPKNRTADMRAVEEAFTYRLVWALEAVPYTSHVPRLVAGDRGGRRTLQRSKPASRNS